MNGRKMGKYVIKSEERPEFVPPGHRGAIARLLIGKENVGAEHMEVVMGIHEAEGETEAHSHDVEQAYYIIEGRARVEVEDEAEEVEAGDIIFFPPGTVHRVNPAGVSYKCLVIYAPPR